VVRTDATRPGRGVGEGPGTMDVLARDVLTDHERVARPVGDVGDPALDTVVGPEEDAVAVIQAVIRAVDRARVDPARVRRDVRRTARVVGEGRVPIIAPVGAGNALVVGHADKHAGEVGTIRPRLAAVVAGTEKRFDLRGDRDLRRVGGRVL